MTPKDFRAHVLQLCDYVEDIHTARFTPSLIDWDTVANKAKQVRAVIMEESHE